MDLALFGNLIGSLCSPDLVLNMNKRLKWTLELIQLDLKYTWAISRNSVDFKINAYIKVSDGFTNGIGEAAPNVRYNESPENFLQTFIKLDFPEFSDLHSFNIWLLNQSIPNALRFGIESAYINYLSAVHKQSVPIFLGINEPELRNTAYTIPIMPAENLRLYFKEYNLRRFKFIKIKVNADNLVSFISETRKHLNATFIIDANEAYVNPDKFLHDIRLLNDSNIAFVEQPFPAGFKDEYAYLKSKSSNLIFADESITDEADFEELKKGFHGVNIKLMKAGGYQNAIRLLTEAKKHGLQTMIGCMVESGLGISNGFYLSSLADYLDLDSFLILKNDPYPYIHEKDGILFL